MNQPLLKVENLSLYYESIQAVRKISFEIFSGEVVSMIGSNGAGKSSTLRGLSGLIQSEGSIKFMNREISGVEAHLRASLGLIHCPEGRGLFPLMSVRENLELGTFHRLDKENISADYDQCFELFPRVKERLNQLAGTLSGGEQQMVAICRAILARPKLLLLDEPSLGLAPLVVAQIFQVIQKLNKAGTSILLVEQNAKQALKISHRAYVLETGSITLSGPASELMNNNEIQKSYLGI